MLKRSMFKSIKELVNLKKSIEEKKKELNKLEVQINNKESIVNEIKESAYKDAELESEEIIKSAKNKL